MHERKKEKIFKRSYKLVSVAMLCTGTEAGTSHWRKLI